MLEIKACSQPDPINRLNPYLLSKITEFLQLDDLETLLSEQANIHRECSFFHLARGRYLIRKYINAYDRAYYYSTFESPSFLQFQTIHLSHFVYSSQFKTIISYEKKVSQVLSFMMNGIPKELGNELREKLFYFLTDPEIPTPPLKRETLGLYATSPFQNFLLTKKSMKDMNSDFIEECFENLKEHLETNLQEYASKMKQKSFATSIRTVLLNSHLITYDNYFEFIQPGNTLNNFIVGLMVLMDLWLELMETYLNRFDGIMLMMEGLVKWGMYQGMIIAIEDSFGFLFDEYSDICLNLDGGLNNFVFWRPAMAKWIKKISKIHGKTNSIYQAMLSKKLHSELTQEEAFRNLLIQIPESPSPPSCQNLLMQVVEGDACQVALILQNYQEYLLDISIDEKIVHWLGHTKQILDQQFCRWQQTLLSAQKSFLFQINNLWGWKKYGTEEIKHLLDKRIEFFSEWLAPRTVKEIVDLTNFHLFVYQPQVLNKYMNQDGNLLRLNKNANIEFPSCISSESSFTCLSKITQLNNKTMDTTVQNDMDLEEMLEDMNHQ